MYNKRDLKCLYTNADQLANKRDDLLMAISHDKPDLIFVTECLPKVRLVPFSVEVLALPGYNLLTNFDSNDRQMLAKGIRGICIYVADYIQATEISFAGTFTVEQLWISIRLKGTDRLMAGCVYRSPSGNPDRSMDELAHLLYSVLAASPSHLLICGDFNVPQIDWGSSFCSASDSHFSHKFLNVVHNCLLFQHVTQPTRFREGETPHTLDLLFTNEEGMLTELDYHPAIGKSDHIVLRFKLACYTQKTGSSLERLNFHRANWNKLKGILAKVNWECLTTLDIESAYKFFHNTLCKAVADCIPSSRHSRGRKNIYTNSKALKLKKRKNHLWTKYMCSQDPVDLARFRVQRNKLRALTRKL